MTAARLTVLVGPSGVGKGTVRRRLEDLHPEVAVSVSATTRAPRPGEIDGRDYHFLSEDEFDDLVDSGQMLEWATYGGHRYGTPRAPVMENLESGIPVLLEIDLAGARQVRRNLSQAHLIFLAPPSWDELVRRLRGRHTEAPDDQERRLRIAREEMAATAEFDEVIVNDDVDQTVSRLAASMGLR